MIKYRPFEDPEMDETFECEECDVSIVVPTFREEKFFPQVIESIANQLINVLDNNSRPLKAKIIVVVN